MNKGKGNMQTEKVFYFGDSAVQRSAGAWEMSDITSYIAVWDLIV